MHTPLLRRFAVCLFLMLSAVSAASASHTLFIPSGTQVIEAEAFSGTTSVQNVVIPDGVTIIEARAFSSSSVSSITLPSSLISIAEDAFENASLEKVFCPEGSFAHDYFTDSGIPCTPPYPASVITAVCPWAEGSYSDKLLRAYSKAAAKSLGVSIRTQNIAGCGGADGHKTLAAAAPDGSTLGIITTELSYYHPFDISNLSYADYDLLCLLNVNPAAIMVNARWAQENGISTLADLIAYCQAHPRSVKLGGATNRSIWHIAGGYLMEASGISVQMITDPNGPSASVQSAAQGDLHGAVVSIRDGVSALQREKLLCLGVMSASRSSVYPAAPTCAESGYPLDFGTFRCIALPKGVNPTERNALLQASRAAAADDEFIAFMEENNAPITYLEGTALSDYLAAHAANLSTGLMRLLLDADTESTPAEMIPDYPIENLSIF